MTEQPTITNKVSDEQNINNALYALIQNGFKITKEGYQYRAGIGEEAVDKVLIDENKVL